MPVGQCFEECPSGLSSSDNPKEESLSCDLSDERLTSLQRTEVLRVNSTAEKILMAASMVFS